MSSTRTPARAPIGRLCETCVMSVVILVGYGN
jgi:hypothetical protein